jgi:hypothetical protein
MTTIFFHQFLSLLFLDPGSGMGKNQDPGSRIRYTASNKNSNGLLSSVAEPDRGSGMNHFFDFLGVRILKFFEDPGSGMETVRIRDGKKSDPG